MSGRLLAPRLLDAAHDTTGFSCGQPSLDDWLTQRALARQSSGTSRTFVVADTQDRVVALYEMAAGTVSLDDTLGASPQDPPAPVPVVVLTRLAVDRRAQSTGLGAALLQDAVFRAVATAEQAGVRALLTTAIDADAKRFFEHHGFKAAPDSPMTLMLRLRVAGRSSEVLDTRDASEG